MMKSGILILSLVLVAQVVLAVTFNLNRAEHGAFQSQEGLLAADPAAADAVVIEGEQAQLRLAKEDGVWRLPESHGFPASGSKVEQVMAELAALQKGWPVATSADAAQRFKVAPEAFERKIVFQEGNSDVATLYLGTSPGFRKVHARLEGENEIYAVPFSAYQAGIEADDWLDAEFLKLDARDISRVQLPDVTLQREGDDVDVVGLAADEETVKSEADSVVRKLAELRVQDVLGSEPDVPFAQDEPALEIVLTFKGEPALTYFFFTPQDGDYYVAKRSDQPYFLKVAAFTVDDIKAVDRETLVARLAPDDAAEENVASDDAGADNDINAGVVDDLE